MYLLLWMNSRLGSSRVEREDLVRDDRRVTSLHELGVERDGVDVERQRVLRRFRDHRLTGRRELLESLGQVDGVADERVLETLLRTEQRGGDFARRETDAESEDRQTLRFPSVTLISPAARACWPRRRRRGRRGRDWAPGAPKTAITASPTNCITVPPSPIIARFIAARWVLSWPASSLGSACSAMVEYERMSLMMTVHVQVARSLRYGDPRCGASPRYRPGNRRDSVSPCSSRSTIGWCRFAIGRARPDGRR